MSNILSRQIAGAFAALVMICAFPITAFANENDTVIICEEKFSADISELSLVDRDISQEDIETIGGLSKLKKLDISTGYAGDELDLSPLWALSELEELDISGREVYIDGISKLKKLKRLTAADIDVSRRSGMPVVTEGYELEELGKLHSLEYLDISDNGEVSLEIFENAKKLRELRVEDMTLFAGRDFEHIGALSGIKALYIRGSVICEDDSSDSSLGFEALSSLTGLSRLDISHYGGYYYDYDTKELSALGKLKNLKYLDISGNTFLSWDFLKEMKRLSVLKAYGCEGFDLRVILELSALRELDVSCTGVSDISPIGKLTGLESLNLAGNGSIGSIAPVSGLKKLSSLNINDVQPDSILPLGGLTSLSKLYAEDSGLRSVSALKNLTEMKVLYISENKIGDISALSGMKKLKMLCANYNEISDISALSGLTGLESLELQRNKIKDISPLTGHKRLRYIDISYNYIESISALEKLRAVEEVYLNNNRISDISALKGKRKLRILWAQDNEIEDISAVSGLSELWYLHLSNNRIKKLPDMKRLGKLEILYLANNQISDIKGLAGCESLDRLFLSGNGIKNASPLNKLDSLDNLDISGNPLDGDGGLSELTFLRELDIRKTGLPEETVLKIAEMLPDSFILSEFIETEEWEEWEEWD